MAGIARQTRCQSGAIKQPLNKCLPRATLARDYRTIRDACKFLSSLQTHIYLSHFSYSPCFHSRPSCFTSRRVRAPPAPPALQPRLKEKLGESAQPQLCQDRPGGAELPANPCNLPQPQFLPTGQPCIPWFLHIAPANRRREQRDSHKTPWCCCLTYPAHAGCTSHSSGFSLWAAQVL